MFLYYPLFLKKQSIFSICKIYSKIKKVSFVTFGKISQSHFSDKLTKKASKFAKCEARIPALVSDPHLCHFIVYTIRNSSR